MSRESVAKKVLDRAEKRYIADNKKAIDFLNKYWNSLGYGTSSADSYKQIYKTISNGANINEAISQINKGGDIFILRIKAGVFGVVTATGNAKLSELKGEDSIEKLIGLGVDIGMAIWSVTPTGFVANAINFASSIITGKDISSFFKDQYGKISGNGFEGVELTNNGFIKATMRNGIVYARPASAELRKLFLVFNEPQGYISGGHKYGEGDVLFGGNGNDTLNGYNGSDILIGGNGYDTYFADYGDIIKDSDKKGRVFVDGALLTGGTQSEEDEKLYYSEYKQGGIQSYKLLDNGSLLVNGSITIENFNKDNNDLGIVLLDQGEISITISDNEKAEGNNGEQSMNFDIKVNGEIPKGEYAIININGQEYLIGNPSTENIKKDNLNISKYKRTLTYTHKWQGNEEKEEDKKFTISGSVVKSSQGLKVKEIISGNGKIIDDDKDDKQDPEDVDPIIIDLNKNKITSTKLNNTIYFDHDNNNFKEATSWIDKGDAFLALDKNSNGLIDNGNELFGNHTISNTRFKYTNNKATNGYEALKAYDLNGDNVIDSKDEIYDKLLLWKDSNQNAITDKGELIKLKDSGIVSIDLNYKNTSIDEKGNTIKQSSTVTFEDGSTTIANDVWFKVNLDKTKQTSIDDMLKDTLINLNKRQDELIKEYKENNNLNTNDLNDDESLQNILNSDEILKTYNDKLNTLFYIKSLPQVKAFGNLSSLQETMANNPKLATMMNLY